MFGIIGLVVYIAMRTGCEGMLGRLWSGYIKAPYGMILSVIQASMYIATGEHE